MKNNQNNNKIFIFGGSGGIGFEICKKFINEGFDVFFSSTSAIKIKKVISKIKAVKKEAKIFGIKCDIIKESDIKKTSLFIIKNNIHVIVNSIGYFGYDDTIKVNQSDLINYFKINTIPSIIINKFISKFKKENSKKTIISIGSSSSYDGFANTISYCASKHALIGAIRSINKENVKKKIINICINPGSVKTKMGKKIRKQKYNTFIDPYQISEFIFNLTKVGNSFFVEDVWLKRTSI